MPLDIESISHVYSKGTAFEHRALHEVSLHIDDGEFIGLIGHTGCGKTTLAQIIGALIKPTSGTVRLNGEDIFARGYDKKRLRRQLGMIFQYPEYQLFEETVYKDIAFGPQKQGLSELEVGERVREAMELVGMSYDAYADRSPFEFSGGQMRRIAIAGVLAMKPSVLVMDEPIAGLDPKSRESLMELTARLNAGGVTIIMISHNMDNIAEYCTRVVALREGQIIMDGTPAEVFSRHREVLEAGLGLPEAARTVMLLRERGVDAPLDAVTQPQLLNWLKGRLCQ